MLSKTIKIGDYVLITTIVTNYVVSYTVDGSDYTRPSKEKQMDRGLLIRKTKRAHKYRISNQTRYKVNTDLEILLDGVSNDEYRLKIFTEDECVDIQVLYHLSSQEMLTHQFDVVRQAGLDEYKQQA